LGRESLLSLGVTLTRVRHGLLGRVDELRVVLLRPEVLQFVLVVDSQTLHPVLHSGLPQWGTRPEGVVPVQRGGDVCCIQLCPLAGDFKRTTVDVPTVSEHSRTHHSAKRPDGEGQLRELGNEDLSILVGRHVLEVPFRLELLKKRGRTEDGADRKSDTLFLPDPLHVFLGVHPELLHHQSEHRDDLLLLQRTILRVRGDLRVTHVALAMPEIRVVSARSLDELLAGGGTRLHGNEVVPQNLNPLLLGGDELQDDRGTRLLKLVILVRRVGDRLDEVASAHFPFARTASSRVLVLLLQNVQQTTCHFYFSLPVRLFICLRRGRGRPAPRPTLLRGPLHR